MTTLEFQLVNEVETNIPRRGSDGAAGVDLWGTTADKYCDGLGLCIPPHKKVIVNTNLKVIIPIGCYGRIAPRSGISNNGVMVNAGVIDSDYTGEIKIMLHNISDETVRLGWVKPIAQFILERYIHVGEVVVHKAGKRVREDTERGENGFGSTDKKVRTWQEAVAEVNKAIDEVEEAMPPIKGLIGLPPITIDRSCTYTEDYPCLAWDCVTCKDVGVIAEDSFTNDYAAMTGGSIVPMTPPYCDTQSETQTFDFPF